MGLEELLNRYMPQMLSEFGRANPNGTERDLAVPCAPRETEGLHRRRQRNQARCGFSLIELIVSVAILIIISAAVFSLMTKYQKVYGTTQLKAEMYSGIRGAAELMTQEIGQAGLVSLPATTLTQAVTASTTAQSVTVSSTTSMFRTEKLLVDAGTAQELVQITGIGSGTITGIFANGHNSGAVVNALGVFPQGVMSSSTATQLRIFGDIDGNGGLVYVHYDCDTTAGTLSRSETTVTPTATASNTSQVILSNLVANPGGTACFQYATAVTADGFTFVPGVAITLSVQTSAPDPETGLYQTVTKSFLNVEPRNVLAGLELANASDTGYLQPTPPNLPLP